MNKSLVFKIAGVLGGLAVSLIAAKESPWWLVKLLGKTEEPIAAVTPTPQPLAIASSEYLIGEWRAEIAADGGSFARANTIDFFKNKRFDGHRSGTDTQGQQVHVSGSWEFEELATDMFFVHLVMDPEVPFTSQQWTVKYKIMNRDRMQNVEGGFLLERTK